MHVAFLAMHEKLMDTKYKRGLEIKRFFPLIFNLCIQFHLMSSINYVSHSPIAQFKSIRKIANYQESQALDSETVAGC